MDYVLWTQQNFCCQKFSFLYHKMIEYYNYFSYDFVFIFMEVKTENLKCYWTLKNKICCSANFCKETKKVSRQYNYASKYSIFNDIKAGDAL